jgi:hypothetical protein
VQASCRPPFSPRVPEATAAPVQVIIAKLHVITVGEFVPIIASFGEADLRAWKPLSDKPDISVEARPLLWRLIARCPVAVIQP